MAVSQSRRCDWSTAIGGKPPPIFDWCCVWKIGGAEAQDHHEPHTRPVLKNGDPMWEGACPRWRCLSQEGVDWSTAIGSKPPPTFDRCRVWKIGGAEAQDHHEPHTRPVLTNGDPMWEGACPRWRCLSQEGVDWSTAIGSKPPPTFDWCCVWKIGGAEAQDHHEPHTRPVLTNGDPMWEGACPRWRCLSQEGVDWSTAIGASPLPPLAGVVSGRLAALKLKTTMSHILGRS
ncbi:hypothetical protein ACVWXD_002665 [Pseudomonas sp. TE3911]